jgi:hypothetical protein
MEARPAQFYFDFGTKTATFKTESGCHRQLVNKEVIIVTRLWLGSRRIKRKEKKHEKY